MQEEPTPSPKTYLRRQAYLRRQETTIALIAAAILLSLLTVSVIAAYLGAKKRTGTIVLPGGITYLGPSTTPTPTPVPTGVIPIPVDASWSLYHGKFFPYTFSYPTTLSLLWFPNDPFDGVTVFWDDTNPVENIFFRVENLTQLEGQAVYIKKPKIEYVQNWWKQYSSWWKGVRNIATMTNAQGLTGYRASYVDAKGGSPFDQIFFEIPGKPELVIWISGKLFTASVFDRIVDSVAWEKPTPAP